MKTMGLSNYCFCISLRTSVTTIAASSSAFCFGILLWLLEKRQVVYKLQDLSAAPAVYWSLMSVVGLYTAGSLFGVIGGITQNRSKINIFRFLYWIVVILLLVSSSTIWIILLVHQNSIIDGCRHYLTDSSTIMASDQQGLLQPEDCHTATKQILIAGGTVVFLGNLIQIYCASIVNAYATRLGQQLNSLGDLPKTSMKSNYL
ncbi:hypothetical protein BD408DRAFT_418961 [Parasitella parasitica]|nr:hypothetical protein BD408DRAFT_418961 [Parasitella parasitica]